MLITHPVTGVRISCNFKYLYPAMTCDPSIVSGVREELAIPSTRVLMGQFIPWTLVSSLESRPYIASVP